MDLNVIGNGRDQGPVPQSGGAPGGTTCMESIRPENADPIPLRTSPQRMGTIMIRFFGLLLLMVAVLALLWSR